MRFLRQAGHRAAGELSRTPAATFSVAGFTRVVLPPHYEGAGGDTPYVLLHVTHTGITTAARIEVAAGLGGRRREEPRPQPPGTAHTLAAKPCGAKRNAFANLLAK